MNMPALPAEISVGKTRATTYAEFDLLLRMLSTIRESLLLQIIATVNGTAAVVTFA